MASKRLRTARSPREAARLEGIAFLEAVMEIIFALPRLKLFNPPKVGLLRLMGARVGRGVSFYSGVWIMPMRGLAIGDDVDLARGVLITSTGGVTIGPRCLIGYGAKIISANHRMTRHGVFGQGHDSAPVEVKSDVWIGANAIILPGVTVGSRSVIAAGAIVTSDVPEDEVWGGVPARRIAS